MEDHGEVAPVVFPLVEKPVKKNISFVERGVCKCQVAVLSVFIQGAGIQVRVEIGPQRADIM